jgi:hypothetical protein
MDEKIQMLLFLLLRCVAFWLCANVSEEHTASIFRTGDSSEKLAHNQNVARRNIPDHHLSLW